MNEPFKRPDKPESEFTEEDWHAVRFRNVLRMCMRSKQPMEPMRKKDRDILASFVNQPTKTKRKGGVA